jgi:desulfoferrodoxin (superoxide reductase-like protein)
MKKSFIYFTMAIIIAFLSASAVFANQTSVKIDVPASAEKGSVITIKINVSHNANSYFHYTDWVYVKVNGKEVGRWDFTRDTRPDNENFTREVKVTVDGPLTIESEGHCNIHGSAGVTQAKVATK